MLSDRRLNAFYLIQKKKKKKDKYVYIFAVSILHDTGGFS